MTDVSHRAGPDALLPPDMALACEAAGTAKASHDAITLFILGLLAGAFIAFGALFMTVTATGSEVMPFGVARLLAGLVISTRKVVRSTICPQRRVRDDRRYARHLDPRQFHEADRRLMGDASTRCPKAIFTNFAWNRPKKATRKSTVGH